LIRRFEMIRRLSRFLSPLFVAVFLPVMAQAAGAARLDFAAGDVRAISAGGETRRLAKGGEVHSGDTVLTGRGGRAQLRFADGAMVSLQPDSEFRVDDYRFAGQADGGERSFFSLLKGGLRTLSGLIGRTNREAYRVTTPVATVGIRGTEYTIAYLDPQTLAVSTGDGSIEVCNQAGCVEVAAGRSAVVRGDRSLPELAAGRPVLGPAQPLFNDVRPPFVAGDAIPNLDSGEENGYAMQFVADGSIPAGRDGLAVRFSGADRLLIRAAGNGESFTIVAGSAEAGRRDGIIGWGRWSGALREDASVMENFHYVTGRLTSLADITGLGDGTYTYTLANGGATTAIDANGVASTLTAASLVANFSGGDMALSLSLKLSSQANAFTGTMGSARAQTFEFSSLNDGQGGTGNASGMFVGANARYVGVSYQLSPYASPSVGVPISGSAALGR
jgi:hypothetical protein